MKLLLRKERVNHFCYGSQLITIDKKEHDKLQKYKRKYNLLSVAVLFFCCFLLFSFFFLNELNKEKHGTYSLLTGEIRVFDRIDFFESINQTRFHELRSTNTVLQHELGHKIYYTYLTDAQREEWIRLSHNGQPNITTYASSSEKENFAENFQFMARTYYTPNIVESVDPAKARFLCEVLTPLFKESMIGCDLYMKK